MQLPALLLNALSEDLCPCVSFTDCDILGPFELDVFGLGTSIIRTLGEEGTLPENTSREKTQVKEHEFWAITHHKGKPLTATPTVLWKVL